MYVTKFRNLNNFRLVRHKDKLLMPLWEKGFYYLDLEKSRFEDKDRKV
jgi:hypothetical protein